MTKLKLVIVGTGPQAEVMKEYFEEYSEYDVVAFACHERYKNGNKIYGKPLYELEKLKDSCPPDSYDLFVSIGYRNMNKMRQSVYSEVKSMGYKCATFIYPNVKIWDTTNIGDNVFIFEDNTIQPFTSIGSNTVLWSGNHIGHHSKVGNHCFVSSHVVISGTCSIGNNVFIGVNATLRDSLKIADETMIAAGATVMKDTKKKEVYLPDKTKPHKLNSEKLGV